MAVDVREQLQHTLSGTYSLERELGGGGMSRVFIATETSLGRKVVIKVLPPELGEGVSVERFKREIQLAAQLTHPHIVPVHAAGETNGLPYYTMPLVDGSSLRTRISTGEPLTITEVLGYLRDVAKALAYAHDRGVVHRDIKPDNVLITGGSAVVTDFGIAKAIAAARAGDGHATLTQIGATMGTPAYMAPEQAAADPNTNHRADIYAFGVMAYELLAGQSPFHGRSPRQLLAAQMTEVPPPIVQRRPDTPPMLSELVMRCMEKDPDARPQSAADLLRVLESVTSAGGHAAISGILILPGGRPRLGMALALWLTASAAVAIVARAAIIVIGLPDWVFPGAMIVMALGLPAILVTYLVHRGAEAAFTSGLTTVGPTAQYSTLTRLAVQASPHLSWRRTALGGVYAFAAFVFLIAAYMTLRALGIGPAGSLLAAGRLNERDMLIVDEFRSTGPDTTLGSVVSEAVRADLAQSPAVTLAPEAIITATLQAMQRPADTQLDLALARELAIRVGAKAVVDGEIRPLGTGYLVTLRLVSADSGRELTSFRASAGGTTDLIETIGKLSRSFRGKIGESLRSIQNNPALPKVTTSSLEALRKFAEATRANDRYGDYPRAIKLLREAIAIDSSFGSAHRKLAVAMSNAQLPQGEVNAAVEKAYRHRDRLTNIERAFATSSYNQRIRRDRAKAIEALEEVLEESDSAVGNNLGLLLYQRREWARAESLFVSEVAKRPYFYLPHNNVLVVQANQGKLDDAQRSHDLARQRFPNAAGLPRTLANLLYLRGQLDSMSELLGQLQAGRNSFNRSVGFRRGAELAMLRGRLAESRRLTAMGARTDSARGRPVPAMMDSIHASLLDIMFRRERAEQGVRRLDAELARTPLATLSMLSAEERPYFQVATLYARASHPERARAILAEYERDVIDTALKRLQRPAVRTVFGEIALAEGRPQDAVRDFREGDRAPDGPVDACASCLPLRLARAFDVAGQTDSALFMFERYLTTPDWVRGQEDVDPTFRAGALKRLGELWEQKGDRSKALGYYLQFVELWKNADAELQPRVDEVRRRIARLRDTESR